ncbi:hypothetical protein [Nonomuraea sp. NPDC003214]
MSGFVQHGDGNVCPVAALGPGEVPGVLPVELDWDAPAPKPGQPIVGVCRNCGRRGIVIQPLPVDPGQADLADRFASWLGKSIGWQLDVHDQGAPLHKELFDLHARVEAVVLEGRPGGIPKTVQQCRECGGDGWPCRTLRVLGTWHKGSEPGWDERWSA